jgi:hypothetical protein
MIVDLRDYTLLPDKRAALVERFEALFMTEQERLGTRMLGSFLDADDPNRFVWLRACPDLETRKRVLTAFYADGAMWKEHRTEVNSWFVDTDNVLLLQPLGELAPPGTGDSTVGMYTFVGPNPLPATTVEDLRRMIGARITAAGGTLLATFATDPVENNYPNHPIRTGEHGLVWFASYATYKRLDVPSVQQRRLIPTTRSRMR